MAARSPTRDASIKGKLTRMVMLTSGAALIMACFGFALYDWFTFREEKVRELSSFAEIIAASSAKSLTEMDADAAGEIVGSLPGDRNILAACLYSAEGDLLTGFVSESGAEDSCPARSPEHGYSFDGGRLELAHPAVRSGKMAGTVVLISGLDEMWHRLLRYLMISGIVLIASIIVAFIASARLRALISEPILRLAGAARAISQKQDFTVRVEKSAGGEIGVLTDAFNDMLTQLKIRDDELREAKGDLEQRYQEKQSQLKEESVGRHQAEEALKESEEALRQSQKMEAVGRLAGGVAHDFNNLLTAIMGYTDMLVGSLDDSSPVRAQLGEIRKASHRAADLTRQLLAFSRKQVMDPKVINLGWIVSNLEKMLMRLIGEDIELVTTLPEGLGRIRADPGQIEQVILNLVVNARDAMPEGGRLAIEAGNVDVVAGEDQPAGVEPGAYVMLQITDSGCGMDEETLTRIYEPFFTTKEEGRGTGLGLSTVYGVVAQSGGTISVQSRPGLGTTFRILFPLVTAEADPAVKADESLPTGGQETILLVEDDELVRDLTRTILTSYGYKVLEASEGTAALRLCQSYQGPIHLMLTDVVMPGLSGPEVYEKGLEMRSEMAVLFMSGYTGMRGPGRERIGPEQPYLAKPFSPVALARKIREVLGAPRGQSSAAAAPPEALPAAAAHDDGGAVVAGPVDGENPLDVTAEEVDEELVLSLETMDGL